MDSFTPLGAAPVQTRLPGPQAQAPAQPAVTPSAGRVVGRTAKRRLRAWEAAGDEDPGAGLVNLFDVWIAFAVALLLALVAYMQRSAPAAHAAAAQAEAPREVLAEARKTARFRPTDAPMTGDGVRLGTAYQLPNGEVVYVPDPRKP